jgi:hypothetical protein
VAVELSLLLGLRQFAIAADARNVLHMLLAERNLDVLARRCTRH